MRTGIPVPDAYIDTSSLAKWYLPESGSAEVAKFMQERSPVSMSRLTLVEMRCLLARRRREGSVDPDGELAVVQAVQDDIIDGHLVNHSLTDGDLLDAAHLVTCVGDIPLRALDAIHLALCRASGASTLATSDRRMADAGEALGLDVVRFGERRS